MDQFPDKREPGIGPKRYSGDTTSRFSLRGPPQLSGNISVPTWLGSFNLLFSRKKFDAAGNYSRHVTFPVEEGTRRTEKLYLNSENWRGANSFCHLTWTGGKSRSWHLGTSVSSIHDETTSSGSKRSRCNPRTATELTVALWAMRLGLLHPANVD